MYYILSLVIDQGQYLLEERRFILVYSSIPQHLIQPGFYISEAGYIGCLITF